MNETDPPSDSPFEVFTASDGEAAIRLRRLPTVRGVDGRLVIDWPDPRPRSFEITAEALQELIDRVNGEYSPVDAIYRTFRDATGKPPHDLRTPWWRRKRGR